MNERERERAEYAAFIWRRRPATICKHPPCWFHICRFGLHKNTIFHDRPSWQYGAFTLHTRRRAMHRLRLQLLRFIANNSFAPLRAPTIPPTTRSHHPFDRVPALFRFSVSCTGNTAPVAIGACACRDVIGIRVCISNGLQPTSVFGPVFLQSFFCSFRSSLRGNFVNKFREYGNTGLK